MRVIIAGATGFIGRKLVSQLVSEQIETTVISRNPEKSESVFGLAVKSISWSEIQTCFDTIKEEFAIVNLSGENISTGKWTKYRKNKILSSRIDASSRLIKAVNNSKNKPTVFIQGSAIGYYPNNTDQVSDEHSNSGSGFLTDVVTKNEAELEKLDKNIRQVIIRTGIVLGKDGGALPSLLKPVQLFLGGKIGTGLQWQSWIHWRDEINAIIFLLKKPSAAGVYNLTSPNPVRQKDLVKTICKTCNRPYWFHLPSRLIRLIFGEMGETIILKGERVIPKRLTEEGFIFEFENIAEAMSDLLNKTKA